MFKTSSWKAINISDMGECLKDIGGGITFGHDIDFGTFVKPLELGNQRRYQNHVAEPMIRSADQDAIDLVPRYRVSAIAVRK